MIAVAQLSVITNFFMVFMSSLHRNVKLCLKIKKKTSIDQNSERFFFLGILLSRTFPRRLTADVDDQILDLPLAQLDVRLKIQTCLLQQYALLQWCHEKINEGKIEDSFALLHVAS